MEELLKLSKDKQSLLDQNGNVLYVAQERDGKTIYVEQGPILEGKVCTRVKIVTKKVCIEWNGPKCIQLGGVDTEICVEWSNE